MGRVSEVEVLGRDAVKDAKDDKFRDEGVALVGVKEADTESCNGPGDESDDDDANNDREGVVRGDSGEDLTGDDAADEGVTEEDNDV